MWDPNRFDGLGFETQSPKKKKCVDTLLTYRWRLLTEAVLFYQMIVIGEIGSGDIEKADASLVSLFPVCFT